MQSSWCYYFGFGRLIRKKLKVEPLTPRSQLSKWNIPHDSSTYPVLIDKNPYKKTKFG